MNNHKSTNDYSSECRAFWYIRINFIYELVNQINTKYYLKSISSSMPPGWFQGTIMVDVLFHIIATKK